MSATAIILARGGSKGIPHKNLQLIDNRTLISRLVLACKQAKNIDAVYVSTDSLEIARESEISGAIPLQRNAFFSTDNISSESSLLDAISQIKSEGLPLAETIFFGQCTSPFTRHDEIQAAIEIYRANPLGTLFSAVRNHDFHWEINDGIAIPVSEGAIPRKRRQDLKLRFTETGAFYIFNLNQFLVSQSRFNDPVRIFESSRIGNIEIDSYEDLRLARQLSPLFKEESVVGTIAAVVSDFDGVLTDDHVYVNQAGEESVKVSRGDGLGFKLLKDAGLKTLILSTEENPIVKKRAEKLGVECIQGCTDKGLALKEWSEENSILLDQICYLGNDLNDLPAMNIVGMPVAVSSSALEIQRISKLVLAAKGGDHALRELAQVILNAKKTIHGGHK